MRKSRLPLLKYLESLRWIRKKNQQQWVLLPQARSSLEELLDGKYPDWRLQQDDADILSKQAWQRKMAQRQVLVDAHHHLPMRLHHKIVSALQSSHSKTHSKPLRAGLSLTKDEIIRMRATDPHFMLSFHDGKESVADWTNRFGEMALPERGWCNVMSCDNVPALCITVENRCYIDMPLVPNCFYLHTPGSNLELSIQVLSRMKPIHWLHFGDFDQKGRNIAESLAKALHRRLNYWEPALGQEYIPLFALNVGPDKEPWKPIDTKDSEFIRSLKRKKLWLEQEPMVTDRRLAKEIESFSMNCQK